MYFSDGWWCHRAPTCLLQCHLDERERDCFYYIIEQTYGVRFHSRRHPGCPVTCPIPPTLGALSKRFKAFSRLSANKVMMSLCAAASMLMTGAMLPGGARAAATDGCRLLAAILAHDLETLPVRPRRKSSALVVSGWFLPLGGRSGPAADDVVVSWQAKLYAQWVIGR